MKAAIAAHNLAIGYKSGNLEVVVGRLASLELKQGKLTCLLGANGVGKSTLLKTITGNLQPLEGEVAINGKSLDQLTVNEKARQIAVVLTDKANLGFTTVKEMITLGRNPYTNWLNTLGTRDSAAINKALQAIAMADFADRPLTELSDGNLQKVIIGRAIAQETDIIVLDEPTIHLDIANKTMIMELLQSLCRKHNKTILLSTHDLELARQYADQFWLMGKDRLAQGFPEDLILAGELDKTLGFAASGSKKTPSKGLKVKLTGDSFEIDLVGSALRRMNYEIDPKASLVIGSNDAGFQITGPGISTTEASVEAVLTVLSNYAKD